MKCSITKLVIASAGTLLAVGVAVAASTNTEKCLDGRVKALTRYENCMQKLIAKAYIVIDPDQSKFSKCRERYAQNWDKLSNLTGTICEGVRWIDNGNETVTDNLTGLVWEKKTNLGGVHNVANFYTWTSNDDDASDEDGTVFTNFLATLNADPGFAGANGWRLPTVFELQTILLADPYPCGSSPCIDATFGPTLPVSYWSTTSGAKGLPSAAWDVDFDSGCVNCHTKISTFPARAVRGGLF